MSVIHIAKYDIKNILTNFWTYISFFFVIFLTATFIFSLDQTNNIVGGTQILNLFSWTLSFLGILFLSKTLTRDFSQETIQKFLNTKNNRKRYFFGKFLSIILIFVFFTIINLSLTYIFSNIVHSSTIKIKDFADVIVLFSLYFLLFGLFLYLLIIISNHASIVFSLAIFIVLIIPFLLNLIPIIPNYKDDFMNIVNNVPILFLPMKLYQGSLTINTTQVIISIFSILLLMAINIYYTIKKNV
ncbi:hypothetical protein HLA86_12270 [Staphylococcus caprae]|uniref:hypothetical protein n=1 Tax=Staphylococcus caprae TaxID=29380 RepID=UPI001C8346DE|nr:hypothetical protein [Staphylococcus caprae]MBX5320270.1 hypothetical protein [Staphylococcus caprae]